MPAPSMTPASSRTAFTQLRADNVSFAYAGTPAVEQLAFTLTPGERVAIVGPNGSGKSTLLRLLLGVLPPSIGQITIDGRTPRDWGRIGMARRMALVPQLAGGSAAGDMGSGQFLVREIILMARYAHHVEATGLWGAVALGFETDDDLRRTDVAMWDCDVHHLADRPLDTLSGGERQRVAIARAMAQDTPVLLLDEPTSALDLHHQLELLAQLAAFSTASPARLIIMVTHDLNLAARFATRVLLLDRGQRVADGPPQEVLTAAHIEAVYRVGVEKSAGPGGMLSFARLEETRRGG